MTISKTKSAASLALLLLCAANFLDAMDVSTIGVALPAIQAELGMKATSLQWAVSAYVLGYGGFLLLGGRVADVFGHRRVFLWSLAVFAAASIAGGFVDSGETLVAARLVKGIAAAFTAPAGLSLLLQVFGEGNARAKALGVFASTGATGFVLGMVLGGAATLVSWRATLVMGAPVALIALALAPFVLPADQRRIGPRPRFDWAGALTITPGLRYDLQTGVWNEDLLIDLGWYRYMNRTKEEREKLMKVLVELMREGKVRVRSIIGRHLAIVDCCRS